VQLNLHWNAVEHQTYLSACLSLFSLVYSVVCLPSVLWHCWLGVRKGIRPVKNEWWGVGVVICLERGADCLHMVQLIPLHPKTPSSLALFRSRLVLPFWYQLTQVVLQKRLLNRCSNRVVFRCVPISGTVNSTYLLLNKNMFKLLEFAETEIIYYKLTGRQLS